MAKVVIENLLKIFPEKNGPGVRAVNDISLVVEDREFMVLVGPSGCGKSTTLRMIAGLEEASQGTITIDGRIVNDVLPKDRDIAMVFQNYALYPHMSVYDNMAFGLKLRGLPKSEIAARVQDAASLLGLESYLDRKPKALSGGQRQRVAVGRAIVRKPKVFLFDEPLSNLDAKMRVSTRTEISKLHARLGATMIYVTHDQVEAMTMGDRICVMKDGNIMQVAEPLTLYNQPDNLFVAGFIGSPPMNFFKGTVEPAGSQLVFVEADNPGGALRIPLGEVLSKRASAHVGRPVIFGIRPENITDVPATAGGGAEHTTEVNIEVVEPMGAETFLYLDTGASSFVARMRASDRFGTRNRLKVSFEVDTAHLFDPATEQVLR
jgi:multiple sugar transport system ATP-binding protein